MTTAARLGPRPPFLGMPVNTDSNLEDGQVLVITHPLNGGRTLIVGTRPLTWVERTMREIIRARLADEYAWLGWPLPTLVTGREILAQFRAAGRG